MKVTKTEQVTRTFCDVCGNEVTHANNTGSYDNENPDDDYTVCMEYNQFYLQMNNGKGPQLGCETLARLYMDFPQLANTMFLQRHDGESE